MEHDVDPDDAVRRQLAGESLGQHEGSPQVGLHMPVPALPVGVVDLVPLENAGVVDQRRLVQEAILLVAGGAAPRAMVAGLRLGDHLLEPARRYAAAAGVRVVPSYTVDEAGLAIIVEADG